MAQGVYIIVNLVNGKVYVGSALDVDYRWKTHQDQLNAGTHLNLHLQSAWNKYGSSFFEFELLEEVNDLIWLRARESAWIRRFEANDPTFGYNMTGDGWSPSPSTPEARAALKRAWIKRKETHGMPAGLILNQFKVGHTPANKGTTYKLEGSQHKNSWTPERKAAQAERARKQLQSKNPATPGRRLSDSHKDNIKAALLARKMREAAKGAADHQLI